MAQQTAVEWLLDRIEDVDNTPEIWDKIKEQAKQMEKEQIINAYDKMSMLTSEQYYNETYGNNTKTK